MGSNGGFQAGWEKLWAAFTAGFPGLGIILGVIGVICVIIFIGKFVLAKVRNGNSKGLWWWLLAGILLTGPEWTLPAILWLVDNAASLAANLVQLIRR